MKRVLFIALILATTFGFANALTLQGVQLDAETVGCISCHEDTGTAPKIHDQWAESAHAKNGIGCMSCHTAEESDVDAFKCPNSDVIIGKKPTPKDCAQCHEQQVQEALESKHSYPFWLYAAADRAVFEPIIGTKQGCESCHNLSAFNPDGSVGECDICHSKHTFSLELARHPNTCGECHLGPDHPQREIYYESKHGNIFAAKGSNWDLSYKSSELDRIPIEAPVCTTCHMDAAPGVEASHNVSARLSWEAQAPWSYRTIWQEDKLGTWEEKHTRMTTVCKNCHAPSFVEDYMLVYDLVNLQYNEIRRQFVKWTKLYEKKGLIKPLKEKMTNGKTKTFSGTVINAGWYTTASELMYNSWHHEGRRFRMGAAMQAADYVQWHGIWELQHNLQEMIAWGAEHGVKEAKEIYESTSPTKFFTYKLYDFPGSIYSIVTSEQFDVPMLYKVIPNYWDKIQANVQQAYKKGFLTKARYDRWMERYDNRDFYLGKKFPKHPVFEEYKKLKDKELNLKDPNTPLSKAIKIGLPSPTPYDEMK